MPYFEIGGMIYETTYRGQTKGLDPLPRTRSSTSASYSTANLKQTEVAQPGQPQQTSTEPSVWKEEADFWKVRAGSGAVGTGVKLGRAAAVIAMADGPLPVGDVIAAGILIGGGIYLIGSGMDWW
jgi:hypothetical protein